MKCELCGAEWVERNGHFHPDNACPLSGVCTYRSLVVAINEAIEQAKKDTRKPEECKYRGEDWRGYDWCEGYRMGCEGVCPCASWTKA